MGDLTDTREDDECGSVEAAVTNIQRYCIHDGPGVRTTVFLKGCTLECRWCCNPENINTFPELGFVENLCNGCGACLETCPEGAIAADSGSGAISIDFERCNNCGKCVEVCYRGALKTYASKMSVAEVFKEVHNDKPVYSRSGGGVTVSGGEPLMQHRFVIALFKLAHQAGIHTAIETCCHVSARILKEVLHHTDYVLFDLKLMDAASHRDFTGQTNQLILKNARIIAASGLPVLPRMPLIPGVNNSEDNIRATAKFLNSIRVPVVELMPYHRFAVGKYESLGRTYTMTDAGPTRGEDIKLAKRLFEDSGVECRISV